MNEDHIKQYGMRVAEKVRSRCELAATTRQNIEGGKWERFTAGKCAEAVAATDLHAIIASVAVPQEQSARQPVAWRYIRRTDGKVVHDTIEMVKWTDDQVSYVARCYDVEVIPLYTAQPVPRDVLMTFGAAVMAATKESLKEHGSAFKYNAWEEVDLAAIADLYASKAQPEPVCQTCGGAGVIGDYLTLAHDCPDCARCDSDPELVSYSPDMTTCTLRIGEEQYLFDRHVDQTEPVNQQLLAEAKWIAEVFTDDGLSHERESDEWLSDLKKAIAAAEQAQQAEPSQEWFNCLIEDISAIDCMYRGDPTYEHDAYWMKDRVIKMLEKRRDATQQQAEPVAAQCRFEGEEWSPCTLAHHLLVQAHPKEWPHYETRALYAKPPAVAVPDGLAMKVASISSAMRTKANNNPNGVKASTLESFADELDTVFDAMLSSAQKGGAA